MKKYFLYDLSEGFFSKETKQYSLEEVNEFINSFEREPQIIKKRDAITVIPFFLTSGQNDCWFQSNTRLHFINSKYNIKSRSCIYKLVDDMKLEIYL